MRMSRSSQVSGMATWLTPVSEAPAGRMSTPAQGVGRISSTMRLAPWSAFPSPDVTPASSNTDPSPVECWGMLKRLERLRSGSTSTSSVARPARDASPAMVICQRVFAVPPLPDRTVTEVAGISYLCRKWECRGVQRGIPGTCAWRDTPTTPV